MSSLSIPFITGYIPVINGMLRVSSLIIPFIAGYIPAINGMIRDVQLEPNLT